MAEGLQRRIEYSDLKFISSFAMEKILDFQTWEVPGEHARGNFRLLLSENETGINSMNAPIQLLGQGNTAGALFSGYPEKVEIKEERGYRIADIQAVSGTILLDQKKVTGYFRKSTDLYGDCQCRNSRYRSLRLHTAGERHANRRDTDTVSGNRLEISEKNGVPAWTSISAGYQLLLSPLLPWIAGR